MAPKHSPIHQEFTQEGVAVHVPSLTRSVLIQKLDLPTLEAMPPSPGGFQPFRAVINLKVVDAVHPESEVTEFEAPIEVRVRYTAADLKKAAEIGKPLSLGFWDGAEWIRFTAEKHQFRLESAPTPQAGGWGIINISRWADPTHAWGT